MTPSEVAEHLGGRQAGTRWLARCPAHEDRAPSLSIASGRDGRVLVHCFAGCTATEICAAAGIGLGELFAPRVACRPASRTEIEMQRRDRERVERAAARLEAAERELRLTYAAECRSLAGLARRTALRLIPVVDADGAARCEAVLAWLPGAERRAQAAHGLVAYAPAAERVRFLLQPAARAEMIEVALVHGLRTTDNGLVEVIV